MTTAVQVVQRRIRCPTRVWAWAATLALSAIAGLVYSRDVAGSLIAEWVVVSSSLREGVTFLGPLTGMVALLYGQSIYGGAGLLVGPTSSRPPERIVARVFADLSCVAVVGYLAGYSVAIFDAVERATTGNPDLLVVVGGLGSLLLFVAVGLGLATIPGRRFGSIIGMLVMVALAGAGASGSLLSLLPTWGGTFVKAGYLENPLLGWFRLAWFVAVVTALLVVAGRRIANREATGLRQGLMNAAPILVLLPFVWFGASRPIDLLVPEQNPPLACTDTRGVEICVHRARIALLDDLKEMVNAYARVFGGLQPFGVHRVYDYLVVPYPDRELDLLAVQLPYDNDGWMEQTATEFGPSLTGRLCEIDPASQDALVRSEVSFGIGLWWYHEAGFGIPEWVNLFDLGPEADPAEMADLARDSDDKSSLAYWRLQALGADQAKDWVLDHSRRIQTCALHPEDLP